ncbi:DNA-binding MarR family transcriptional regulator [Salinibacterium sp. CAN_S4]|uniref:MarR family winged helix-turn-helix transcriptional regulator n=1 Tax=Salinibacterium sp. CAN_S4 TaxID=2787727 RepID=UPI001A2452C1
MSDEAIRPLEEQICFALYSASRSVTGRYRELLAPLGVTYPQYLVLLILWETGTSTVRQLGDRLELDSGTLSPLVKRLQVLGLVTRTRSTLDERVVEISLTPAGSAMSSEAPRIAEQICASTGFGPVDLAGLQQQIATLATQVRQFA